MKTCIKIPLLGEDRNKSIKKQGVEFFLWNIKLYQ